MKSLLSDIKACQVCKEHLPLGPKPIVAAHPNSKIILASQAPGRLAHLSGKAWDDPSGKILRKWLDVSEDQFYKPENFAILPTGFCYPGKGKSGDLPPRKECAPLWHKPLLDHITHPSLIIVIGQYAQKYHLNNLIKKNLTATVKAFDEYLPDYFPLPHPSPRNRFWLTKNPWFEKDVIPVLQEKIKRLLS